MQNVLWLSRRIALVVAALCLVQGCDDNIDFVTDDRMAGGLVVILPGIEGESELNRNIRRGLVAGGVFRALPIHRWGRPVPIAGVLLNQVDFLGNRLAGVRVAKLIQTYQDSHPGKPVHVVGHSGGGGVAVFAAEAMPEGRKIDGLILLSASISSAYNLTKALSHCRNGIVSFYNPDDFALLGVGTTALGNVDGTHGPSAGLIGFDKPRGRAGPAKNAAWEKLYQVKLGGLSGGDGDPHASTTRVGFVSLNVAPWVLSETWPAAGTLASARLPAPPAPEKEADTPKPEEKPKPKEKPNPKENPKAPEPPKARS